MRVVRLPSGVFVVEREKGHCNGLSPFVFRARAGSNKVENFFVRLNTVISVPDELKDKCLMFEVKVVPFNEVKE
jgi:hypothetical protein